jgi:hypothetical protein
MEKILKKIISGGQTGADTAALEAAKAAMIETGGAMPSGFKNESGLWPQYKYEYDMYEISATDYPSRTRENIIKSDATLIITKRMSSNGTQLTQNLCHSLGKPCFCHTKTSMLYDESCSPIIVDWLIKNKVSVLNVAGNRASLAPDIDKYTYSLVWSLIQLSCSVGGPCIICNERVSDFIPKVCCDGRECGCMGLPVNYCICDKSQCLDKMRQENQLPF